MKTWSCVLGERNLYRNQMWTMLNVSWIQTEWWGKIIPVFEQRFIFGFFANQKKSTIQIHFPFLTNDFRLRSECDQIPSELEQRIITMSILISFKTSFHFLAKLQSSIDTILPWNVQKIRASAMYMNVNVENIAPIRRYSSKQTTPLVQTLTAKEISFKLWAQTWQSYSPITLAVTHSIQNSATFGTHSNCGGHPFHERTATCSRRPKETFASATIHCLVHVTVSTRLCEYDTKNAGLEWTNRIEIRTRARQLMNTNMDISGSGGGDSITYSRNTNRFVQQSL